MKTTLQISFSTRVYLFCSKSLLKLLLRKILDKLKFAEEGSQERLITKSGREVYVSKEPLEMARLSNYDEYFRLTKVENSWLFIGRQLKFQGPEMGPL